MRTPSLSARRKIDCLNGPGCIGVNLLNSGSTATGYRKEPASVSSREAPAAQANHQRGDLRANPTTTSSTSAVPTQETNSPLATSTDQPPQPCRLMPKFRSTTWAPIEKGRVTTRCAASTAAAPTGTPSHQRRGSMRPSIRDPTPVSPTASKSPSERKYDVQPNARCRAAYLSARAICAGVNKASGATGTRRPPGTQSHGTSHAARATTATALTIRVVSAAPRARPCREVVVTAPSLSRSPSEIAKVGLPRAGEPFLVGVQHPCERDPRRGQPIGEA